MEGLPLKGTHCGKRQRANAQTVNIWLRNVGLVPTSRRSGCVSHNGLFGRPKGVGDQLYLGEGKHRFSLPEGQLKYLENVLGVKKSNLSQWPKRHFAPSGFTQNTDSENQLKSLIIYMGRNLTTSHCWMDNCQRKYLKLNRFFLRKITNFLRFIKKKPEPLLKKTEEPFLKWMYIVLIFSSAPMVTTNRRRRSPPPLRLSENACKCVFIPIQRHPLEWGSIND